MNGAAVRRVGLRFLAVYAALFCLPFPIDSLPVIGSHVGEWLGHAWRALDMWVATDVLGIPGPIFDGPTGSGDTTLDYVHVLVTLVLAVVGTAAWTTVRRHRDDHPRLWYAVRTYLRFYLCVVMLGYGFAKVFKTQFPAPSPSRLMERYGESSPMALLWTFMGASTPYTIFAGTLEVLGAVLLAFRPTATLGALVVAAVMSNVVM